MAFRPEPATMSGIPNQLATVIAMVQNVGSQCVSLPQTGSSLEQPSSERSGKAGGMSSVAEFFCPLVFRAF